MGPTWFAHMHFRVSHIFPPLHAGGTCLFASSLGWLSADWRHMPRSWLIICHHFDRCLLGMGWVRLLSFRFPRLVCTLLACTHTGSKYSIQIQGKRPNSSFQLRAAHASMTLRQSLRVSLCIAEQELLGQGTIQVCSNQLCIMTCYKFLNS